MQCSTPVLYDIPIALQHWMSSLRIIIIPLPFSYWRLTEWAKACYNVSKIENNLIQCLVTRLSFIWRCNFIPIKIDAYGGWFFFFFSINETILTNCSCKPVWLHFITAKTSILYKSNTTVFHHKPPAVHFPKSYFPKSYWI